jgi:hypothetical protein
MWRLWVFELVLMIWWFCPGGGIEITALVNEFLSVMGQTEWF